VRVETDADRGNRGGLARDDVPAAWGWTALEQLLLRGIGPEPIRLTERQAADLVALLRRCSLAGLALGLAIGVGAGLLIGRLL
jgi:hypothetical protein